MSIDLNSFDPFNLQVPVSDEGSGGSTLILKVPGPSEPLIVKLLPDPKGRAYTPVNYYRYSVGPNPQTDSRSRPSRSSLGLTGEKDLEDERKWVGIMGISGLKKASPLNYRESPKYKAFKAIADLYSPKEGGWIFVIEPESSTIKALKLNKMMINSLFGRKGEGQIKAVVSVVDSLHKKGKSPYKMDHQDCWLKIYKTGEGLATEYFVEHHAVDAEKVIDGESVAYKKAVTLKVNDKFLAGKLSENDYPEPLKFDEKQVFSVEETREFIETDGVMFPERFGKSGGSRNKEVSSDESETSVSNESFANVSGGEISLSDIPF